MPDLYLTPASVSYLNQFLLSLLITAYLAARRFGRERAAVQRQDQLLLLFFACVTIFSLLFFLEASFLPAERFVVVCLENTVLAILLAVLIQFAYHFPAPRETQKTERTIALALTGLYILAEAGFAAWRLLQLKGGRVEFRYNLMDVPVALAFLWVIFVFARSSIQNRGQRASRRFAWTFVIPLWLAILNILRSFYAISTPAYHINLSVGILFTIFIFALNYLASLPERTSFITKVSGAVLTSVLAVFGVIAWLVAPAYAIHYHPAIIDHRAIRFTPNAGGGYDVRETPFHFEEQFGQNLNLYDETGNSDRAFHKVDFEFPFLGQRYESIFITNDGALGIGSSFTWKEYQYHFTSAPMIIPLLVDLNPQLAPTSGVFLRQETDRLLVTWLDVPSYNHPEARYTFQVALFSDGSFEFTYNSLPAFTFYVDDRPEATAWAIGYKPAQAPQANADFANLPLQGGPEGLLQDEYRSFRKHLHNFMLPLAAAVLTGGLLFLTGLPLLLNYSLIRPLNTLLKGVQDFNRGKRGDTIPVQVNDEIGFLTDSFNRMSAELDGLIRGLETRVAARTSDLLAANEQLRKLTSAIEQSPSAIIITDTQARIEYVNLSFSRTTGYTFEEVKGRNPRFLKSSLTPPETYEELWHTIAAGRIWRGELVNCKKNGEIFWEHSVIAPIFDNEGETTHYVAVKEDITERVHAEQALRESEKQYRDLFDLESDALFIIRNSDGRILEANTAASQLYGFTREELLAKHNTELSAEPEATQKATNSPAPSDVIVKIPLRWHRKKDGARFPVGITARFVSWKGESVHIAAIRDITEQYQIEQELVHLAVTDALTGLPNRRHFLSQAEQMFARANQPPYSLALMMLDIDHFKNINDQFGHAAGDAALQQTAHILGKHLRSNDLLARMGGEEFAILLPRAGRAEAAHIGGRLCETLSSTVIRVLEYDIRLTISIGVVALDESVHTLDELLRRADQALYKAKEAGRNCCEVWTGQ